MEGDIVLGGFCPCCRAAIWAFSSAIVFCDVSSNCRSLVCKSWTFDVWEDAATTPMMNRSAKFRVILEITSDLLHEGSMTTAFTSRKTFALHNIQVGVLP